jgi:hypothetical protein
MAEGATSSGSSSGGSGSSSSYSGYAQAGASTLGTILDAVNNKNAREYNQKLQEIAMWQAERNRGDVLRQQDFSNQQTLRGMNMSERKLDEDISMGREQLGMLKKKNVVDSLRRLANGNPSLTTGLRTLFSSRGQ